MATKDPDGKPRAPTAAPARPQGPAQPGSRPLPLARGAPPARPMRGTSDSAFELTPVRAASRSVAELPRVATGPAQPRAANPWDEGEKTVTHTGASAPSLPRVAGVVPQASAPIKRTNPFQKQLRASAFDDDERTQIDAMLGKVKQLELDDDEEPTAATEFYDGETPADDVTSTDTWKAVQAPVQSKPRRRSARVLWTLLDQFAVAHNPRYRPATPLEARAHIFLWDVSLAMGCEVPHFRAGREMTLAHTIDWVRREGPTLGWQRAKADGALAAADRGELVVALPVDLKVRTLAIVRPGGAGDDGLPRVATAGPTRNNDASVRAALGDKVDYYFHP